MVTNLKPDLVIIDQKKVKVFELTVPAEQRIKIANKLKMEKYSHFTTDIKSHEVTVTPFKVGAGAWVDRVRLRYGEKWGPVHGR